MAPSQPFTRSGLVLGLGIAACHLLAGASPARAQSPFPEFTRPSTSCPGALERVQGDEEDPGSVIEIVIPSGATASCLTLPPDGADAVGTGAGIAFTNFAAGIQGSTPIFHLSLSGTGHQVTNEGDLDLVVEGDGSRVANGAGFLKASVFGDDAIVTNDAVVLEMTLEGDRARVTNNLAAGRGIANELPGAIGFLVIGEDGEIANAGGIGVAGSGAEGIGIVGDTSRIENTGGIVAHGEEAVAAGIEGDAGRITNDGTLQVQGAGSSAAFVEGSGAFVINRGNVAVDGFLGTGLVAVGPDAEVTNETGAEVATTGGAFVAMGALGDDATLTNRGGVETDGSNALGLAVIGPNATIANGADGSIETRGANADGIAMGLEELPPGAEALGIPPGLLAPARGSVTNEGEILTDGTGADGISAFASRAEIANRGIVEARGSASTGIRVVSDRGIIQNDGTVLAGSALPLVTNSVGIEHEGLIAEITNEGSITVNAQNAVGILATGAGAADAISDLINRGTIDANGPDASGIRAELPSLSPAAQAFLRHVIRNDPDAILRANGDRAAGVTFTADDLEVVNQGFLAVIGNDARGIQGLFTGAPSDPRLTHLVSNQKTLTVSQGERVRGVDVIGDDVVVENGEASIDGASLSVTGGQAVGVRLAGDRGAVHNRGFLEASGASARAVWLVGEDLSFENAIGSAGAVQLRASGADAAGVLVEGMDTDVQNLAELEVEGLRAVGIDVRGELTSGRDQVLNFGALRASGGENVGMRLRADELPIFLPGPPGGTVPDRHVLDNLGEIEVSGDGGVGMAAVQMRDTFVQNARSLSVEGDGARGIQALGVAESVVANPGTLSVVGDDAIGIELRGDRSTIVHGNGFGGSVPIPVLIDGSPQIDPLGQSEVFLTNDFSIQVSFDDEDGTFIPVGETTVTGANAVGIRVEGSGNQVGIAKSASPDAGGDAVSSSVRALGAGGIGVELVDSGTVLLNDGVIQGTDAAIVGSAGRDVVVNRNELSQLDPTSGPTVRLGGGDDLFLTNNTDLITGLVDGGAGLDELHLFAGVGSATDFDLGRFQSFESTVKLGAGVARLVGGSLQDTLVLQGVLALDGVHVQGDVTAGRSGEEVGRIEGSATIEGQLAQRGGDVAIGSSPGRIEAGSYLLESGTLEIEIAGLGEGEHDSLVLGGSAEFLGGVIAVSFLDGFSFELGEDIDFLSAADVVGLENVDLEVEGLAAGLGLELFLDGGSLGVRAVAVPEPGTLALLGLGLAGLWTLRPARARGDQGKTPRTRFAARMRSMPRMSAAVRSSTPRSSATCCTSR